MANVVAVLAAPIPWTKHRQRPSDRAGEARGYKQRNTERDDGFAAKSVGDGSVEKWRDSKAEHEGAHRQADFGGAYAKCGASRRKRRQIDIDTGIRHGREKAEQQRESRGRWLNLHAANAPNFWMFLKEGN